MNSYLPFLVALPLIAFWAWMFWDMVHNEDVPPNVRNIWLVGFVLLSLPVAVYYFFAEYSKR